MGIVLGTEAAIGITEAAEAGTAAAEAGEAASRAAEAGEAISWAEEGAEAGTEAGEDAREASEYALSSLAKAGEKIAKMVKEYIIEIDTVFKMAKAILEMSKDPKAHERALKLTALITVLNETGSILDKLNDWLTKNTSKEVDVKEYVFSLQGVLSKFIPQIGSSAAVLKKLASQVSKKNVKKDPITDGELGILEKGLDTVLESFKKLADFKQEHMKTIKILNEMPIDENEVSHLLAEMPEK